MKNLVKNFNSKNFDQKNSIQKKVAPKNDVLFRKKNKFSSQKAKLELLKPNIITPTIQGKCLRITSVKYLLIFNFWSL